MISEYFLVISAHVILANMKANVSFYHLETQEWPLVGGILHFILASSWKSCLYWTWVGMQINDFWTISSNKCPCFLANMKANVSFYHLETQKWPLGGGILHFI